METITINEKIYKIHPIFNLNAGSEDGSIIHIINRVPCFGSKNKTNGYLYHNVRRHKQNGVKNYRVNRFIYECFNGVIPNGMQVDHKDDNRENNKLSNLQLLTPKQNCKKT